MNIEDAGKITDLILEGENVEILGTTYSGLIAYTPDYNSSSEIFIDKFDAASSPSRVYNNKINGALRIYQDYNGFSDDEAKFAYIFAPSDNDGIQHIGVINIDEASECPIGMGIVKIYIMNIDGSEQVNLTNSPVHDSSPCISPDGTKIVLESYPGPVFDYEISHEIYIMNIDGSGKTDLQITLHMTVRLVFRLTD